MKNSIFVNILFIINFIKKYTVIRYLYAGQYQYISMEHVQILENKRKYDTKMIVDCLFINLNFLSNI